MTAQAITGLLATISTIFPNSHKTLKLSMPAVKFTLLVFCLSNN